MSVLSSWRLSSIDTVEPDTFPLSHRRLRCVCAAANRVAGVRTIGFLPSSLRGIMTNCNKYCEFILQWGILCYPLPGL
jgi:hypothetical protein